MAKVYSLPSQFKVPTFEFENETRETYHKKEQKFIAEVAEYLRRLNPGCPETGKVIKFPVADGHAVYMVYSMKPVGVVHLPFCDGYHFQHITLFNAKTLREEIKSQEAWKKLWEDAKKQKQK